MPSILSNLLVAALLASLAPLHPAASSVLAMPTSAGILRRASEVAPARPSSTPIAVPPRPPIYDEDKHIQMMIDNMAAAAMASHLASVSGRSRKRSLDDAVDLDSMMSDDFGGDTVLQDRALHLQTQPPCLGSNATDFDINSAFYYGGANTTVWLCPRATIYLNNTIFFTAPNQVLATQGFPTDSSRAQLIIQGANQSCAIYGGCDACSGITLSHIQVLGQRDVLGYMQNGLALLELGGMGTGQIVRQVKALEPRGWSVLHGIEGTNLACSNMLIENNQIGPSGNNPSDQYQLRRRADITPGQWADGISLACKGSTVRNNVVTDATDGGIVIFGAPGSTITGNTVRSLTRRALGGINAVDWGPFSGSFEGTVVENNVLITEAEMMKVGIAIGGMVWGSDNRTASRTYAGTFRNNIFQSSKNGYFGYGIAVAGHERAIVMGNDISLARFGGSPGSSCIPDPMIPTPQGLVYDTYTTPGATLQSNFANFPLVFLICSIPGPIQPLIKLTTTASPTTTTTTTVNASAGTAAAASTTTTKSSVYTKLGRVGVENPPIKNMRIKRDGDEEGAKPPSAKTTPVFPVIGFENPFALLERVQRDRCYTEM